MAPSILIVDDEPELLRLLVRTLEREGLWVVAVEDGERALATLASSGVDLAAVVLDVNVPPRGGGELLDALSEAVPGLGVVMVSGDALPPELSGRLEAVGGVFLRKPFQPAALVESVRRVVRAGVSGGGV